MKTFKQKQIKNELIYQLLLEIQFNLCDIFKTMDLILK